MRAWAMSAQDELSQLPHTKAETVYSPAQDKLSEARKYRNCKEYSTKGLPQLPHTKAETEVLHYETQGFKYPNIW